MKWNSRTRIFLLALLLAGVFSVFSARLVHLQVARHAEFTALAAQKNSQRQTIHVLNLGRPASAPGCLPGQCLFLLLFDLPYTRDGWAHNLLEL